MPKSKVSAFISVLLVFVGGVAVGSLGYRLYDLKTVVSTAGPKKMTPEEARKHAVARLKEAVKLDDQQIAQLQKIMDDTHDGFEQINQRTKAAMDPIAQKAQQENQALREQQIAKVKAMLRDDQQPLYAKYLADREVERKKWQAEHQKQDRKDGKGPGSGFPPPPSR